MPDENDPSRAVTSCPAALTSPPPAASRLSQYTLVPAATVNELGTNALPWIKTNADTLDSESWDVNTLEPEVAWTVMVESPAAAPLAALRVIVTGLETWSGRLTELGWKVAVIPFGRDVAESAYVPETVPIAVSFRATLSFTSGATMRGCFVLMVSVPDEEPVLVVEGGFETEVDVVEDVATMGIVT